MTLDEDLEIRLAEDFQQSVRLSADTRFLHRLHCVKLVSEGCDPALVGKWFSRPQRTIERWVRQYAEEGGAGLIDKPRKGRPATISDEMVPEIEYALSKSPEAFGYDSETWTGVLLRELLATRHGVDLSLRQSQRLLKKMQP